MRAGILLACLVVLAVATGGGCGSDPDPPAGVLRSLDTSWATGQPSLSSFPGFLSIASRAEELAARRLAERKRELALLEAARIAASKRKRDAKLRAYLEAKRRAEAAYRAALRRAAIARRRALARLRAARRKRAALLRKLNEKLRVPVGEECRDPRVRRYVECRAGRLPVKKPT